MQNRLTVIIFRSFSITVLSASSSIKKQQSIYLSVKLGKNQSYISDTFNISTSAKDFFINCHSDNDEIEDLITSFQLPHTSQFQRNIQDQYFAFEIWNYDSRKILASTRVHMNVLKDNDTYCLTLEGQNYLFKIVTSYGKQIASSSSEPRISPYHTNFLTQNTPTNGRGISLNHNGKPQYFYLNPQNKHRKQQRNSSDNNIVPSLKKVQSCNLKKQQKNLLLNFRDLTQRSRHEKSIDQGKYESHRDSLKKYSYKLIPEYHFMGKDNLNTTTKKISIKNRNMVIPTYKKSNDSFNQLKL